MSSKKRYCECGRECEKGCRLCSECRAVSDYLKMTIRQHNFEQTDHRKKYQAEWKRNKRRVDKQNKLKQAS